MNDQAIIFWLLATVATLVAALLFTYGRLSYYRKKNKELEEKIKRIIVENAWRNCYTKFTEYAKLVEQVSEVTYIEILEFRNFCDNKLLESNNPSRQTVAEIIDMWWKKRREWEKNAEKAYISLPKEKRKGQLSLRGFVEEMHVFANRIFGDLCAINYNLS